MESFAEGPGTPFLREHESLQFSGQSHFLDKTKAQKGECAAQGHEEVVRWGYEPTVRLNTSLIRWEREQPDSGFSNRAGRAGAGGTVPPSLCYQGFTWPSSSPALTENRRGPSEKSRLEGMGCIEGPKPVPHTESSSRQVDCVGQEVTRASGKGTEGGRKEPALGS